MRDPALQVRDGMDAGTIKQYENVIASNVELPPVRVVAVGAALYLVDGWHRLAAHERRGAREVLGIVTEGNLNDARWLAAQANLTHGLPLRTRGERRRVFAAYMAARRYRDGRGYKSYRNIAAELSGVAEHTTIRNWMVTTQVLRPWPLR